MSLAITLCHCRHHHIPIQQTLPNPTLNRAWTGEHLNSWLAAPQFIKGKPSDIIFNSIKINISFKTVSVSLCNTSTFWNVLRPAEFKLHFFCAVWLQVNDSPLLKENLLSEVLTTQTVLKFTREHLKREHVRDWVQIVLDVPFFLSFLHLYFKAILRGQSNSSLHNTKNQWKHI